MEDLGLVEACYRPVQSQWVCPSNPFQDGDQPVGPSAHSERRLDGLHRPEGCLPSGSCPSRHPSFSSFRGGRTGLPILSTLFWPFHCATGLHLGHGFGIEDSTSHGHQVALLPRLFALSCLLPSGGSTGEGPSTRFMSPTRDRCQSPEVGPRTLPDCHLSGHGDNQPLFEGFPLSREGHDPSDVDRRISIL